MTKEQVVKEISKRLGDPDAVAFADRIWGYFIEGPVRACPYSVQDGADQFHCQRHWQAAHECHGL